MEQAELDVALEELETRLERLRALYEQYFMGIERIEPAIARKDVDRRIYVLRREKIRNTAKRFKLQTIIQRYNTFQQYWQRICREIENGTYKRHLLKAEKNGQLLTIAARKRLGKAGRASQPPGASPSQLPAAPASAPPSSPPIVPREAPAPTPAPATAGEPAPTPATAGEPAPTRPLGSPPLPPRRPPLPGARPVIEAAPASAMATAAPVAPALTMAPKPAAPAKPAPTKFESLDLDMDFMGDWDPAAAARRPGATTKPATPTVPAAKPPAAPPAATRVIAPLPAGSPLPPVTSGIAKPVPIGPPKPEVAPPPKPALPAAPPHVTSPGSIPPRPVSVPPRPTSSSAPRAPTRPLTPRVAQAPAVARPAAAPLVPKPAPAAAPSVDDQRLRDLHARLQQARQQTKEANVSYEGLARSIRATEAKLREQHKNRKIDFDIVIKDGKAVVKPIVR